MPPSEAGPEWSDDDLNDALPGIVFATPFALLIWAALAVVVGRVWG